MDFVSEMERAALFIITYMSAPSAFWEQGNYFLVRCLTDIIITFDFLTFFSLFSLELHCIERIACIYTFLIFKNVIIKNTKHLVSKFWLKWLYDKLCVLQYRQ